MDEHAAAVKALLDANENIVNVYDGPKADTEPVRTPPYVTFYVHVPYEARTKINGDTDETWITVVTHAVGDTTERARIVARSVRTSLLDVRPAVTGWKCERISHESGSPPDWTSSSGGLVADQVDQWDYRCEPVS